MTEVPLCLKRAGEEVLLALRADSTADERRHRQLADELMTVAVRDMQRAPERVYDWSQLGTTG